MTSRSPAEPQLLEAAARLVNLEVTSARAKELVPAASGIFAMLDALDPSTLGEAAPATAFQAKWED